MPQFTPNVQGYGDRPEGCIHINHLPNPLIEQTDGGYDFQLVNMEQYVITDTSETSISQLLDRVEIC